MKDLLKKPVTFEKVEFWAATALFIFSVFILLSKMTTQDDTPIWSPYTYLFEQYNVPFSYTKYYFLPQLVKYTIYYSSFILLNFYVVKSLLAGRWIFLNVIIGIATCIAAATFLSVADTWIRSYMFANWSENYVYRFLFKQEYVWVFWALIIFGFYTIGKQILALLLVKLDLNQFGDKRLMRELMVVAAIAIALAFFQGLTSKSERTTIAFCETLLFGVIVYWYTSYRIIPGTLQKGQDLIQFSKKLSIPLVIAAIPITIFYLQLYPRLETAIIMSFFNLAMGLFTGSLSWFIYNARRDKTIELQGLKTALGSSSANLDFLRSQINPHFLFNALNTLYGTSLQENAERTGEGIQKLGDMMRFMLQENMQEKISLAREVDYLNNYIDLQKLRTQTSPDIIIQTEIDDQLLGLEIAPMLLIPFVENAFKHGISLREPSHIKISLQTRGKELLFDVYNSIHHKQGIDPEKDKSGIGLENVKQRLLLLYPKRHDLVIRESAKEFFVHLTIQL
ncbi:MAG: sensor histidine kinase [Mucilaginibacter sp.]